MVPGALEQARVPQLLAAQCDLLFAEHVGLADLQGHVLAVGVLLHVIRENECLDDVLPTVTAPVRLHQRRRPVA